MTIRVLHTIAGKPKYYFIFPVVVAVLFSTSLIQIPCPVCEGSGTLSQSIGMQNIRIVSIESRILDNVQDACTGYIVTSSNPIITVTNAGSETAMGYLSLHLIDLTNGQELAHQNLALEAAPNALTVLQSYVYFPYNTVDTPPEDMDIRVEVRADNIECSACNGSGHIGLSAYLLTRSYKDKLVGNILSQSEYSTEEWTILNGKKVLIGSPEWMDWMELN